LPAHWSRAIGLPTRSPLSPRRARPIRRTRRLGEAQRHIEYAATLAPRDPAVGLEAGVIAAMAGRAEQARASFQSVIDVAPESVEAGRARTYLTRLDGGTQQTEPRGR
jgi:hypothetical protein